MAIATDFEIQSDKDIRYIGAAQGASGAGYYSVYELHVWAQGLADDEAYAGDDIMDITKDTPSEKAYYTIITLLNGFNIDEATSEHLYGGSIIQSDGDTIYDGIQVVAPLGTHMEIIRNGTIVANDFWNTTPFGSSYEGLNSDAANGISHQFIFLVRTAGADIDNTSFIATTREWGKNYGERKINATGRGVNVVALPGGDSDLNNTTVIGTVAGWAAITNVTSGYNAIDVNNDTVNEYYYSEWNKDSFTINQFYERMKWVTRRGTAETLYGLTGDLFRGITHEITVDNPSATDFSSYEPISWSGGTGQMLAINDVSAPTKMWIQLLTGIAPINNQQILGGTSGATCDVNVTILEKSISSPFCGVSTGSSIIGSFGFGIEASDLSALDKVFDLTGTQRQAPNYQIGTVAGMDVGDYVLAANNDGGAIDFDQLTLNTTLSGGAVTAIVVTASIPSDTPQTGTIRVQLDTGKYRKVSYTSWASSTFTIGSTDFTGANVATAPRNVFISYLDTATSGTSESFTAIYSSARTLFIRVRDGGGTPKKTFETTATFGSGGFSISTSKIDDN